MIQRATLGLLLAALLLPVASAAGLIAADFSVTGVKAAFAYAALLAAFSVPITFILGVPLLMWYRRARWHAWHQYVVGGAVLGLLPLVLFAIRGSVSVLLSLALAIGGAVSALLLWAFTGRHEAKAEKTA